MVSFSFPDTIKLIELSKRVLYGDAQDWMLLMASDLGVRVDTVSAWARGRRTPSHAVVLMLQVRVGEARKAAAQLDHMLKEALPKMLCPECSTPLKAIHAAGARSLACENGHRFTEVVETDRHPDCGKLYEPAL